MNPNPVLDAIIARETFAEMLASLTPQQLAVVALRLDGLPFLIIDQYLGISRGCGYERIKSARQRLRERFPHIQTMLATRSTGCQVPQHRKEGRHV